MRDIRPDIQERIDEIDREVVRVEASLLLLRDSREQYAALLREENERWSKLAGNETSILNGISANANGRRDPRTPLARLVLEVLSDGEVHSEREVMDWALKGNYPFGEKHPLKSVHFAMTGMGQTGTIESAGKAQWRLPATKSKTA